MRDMYVPIPGYSDNRINAAYQFGGMELLDKTIKKDFGVSVDGNMEVSFEGFIQLVDMREGLTLS
jgi:anionic cell wall polymer biosynthesis LytR-Cps2A-Psr (LCP) family protein